VWSLLVSYHSVSYWEILLRGRGEKQSQSREI
jgi:hypothetical protein